MPRFAGATHLASLLCALSIALFAGCPTREGDSPCSVASPAVPSFRITIVAPGGELPPDLTIRVRTGAGEETYDLSRPCSPDASLVCYDAAVGDLCGTPDAAAGKGRRAKLTCNLWTDGTADVTVSGRGHPTATRRLVPQEDACGDIETSEAEIALDPSE